tara:strand:+ start:764 stop:1525 length:762 start_codon:yes stop_codon:yes gene_type:complete
MIQLYQEAINKMVVAFNEMASQLGVPKRVFINGGYAYRYEKKTIYVAIFLKLARVVTGLQAIIQLNSAGLLQEQAVIHRVADELTEDITFLTFSVIFADATELHNKYLEAFFEEEIEGGKSAIESAQKRPMVPRKKIRSYINKDRGAGEDPGRGAEISRTLSKTYSGYVHAAAPQIMELFSGDPPIVCLGAAHGSPLYQDHVDDMFNYFYRGLIAFSYGAKSFGNEGLFTFLFEYTKEFATKSGRAEYLVQKP